MKIINKILLLTLTFISINVNGQDRNQDSILVAETVYDFFEWYIYSNKYENNEENRPVFRINSSDTAQLDLTKYLANLTKYKFSETLLNKERLAYKACEDNLNKMTKEKFLSFDDIFEYENIGCDFDNSYKWIGGQELCDGIKINRQIFIDNTSRQVEIEYYSINGEEKSFWRNSIVISLIKVKNEWIITDVDI
ncbi:hypothetical protein [uncultured Roseivirga sp.]|uniref:hypothetical protein n=1 Tax=uncultured Roseivirga sp. TaxID=543088 RepID=UPI0030DD5EFE|tara:strand:+ start:187754 stop:188335 length:582 start_codon:yes stop_codon:yes gene_type:complete